MLQYLTYRNQDAVMANVEQITACLQHLSPNDPDSIYSRSRLNALSLLTGQVVIRRKMLSFTFESASKEALPAPRIGSEGTESLTPINRVVENKVVGSNGVKKDLERAQRQNKKAAALALLQGWMDEELTDEESAEAVQSWEESMKSLDEHRLSARPLFVGHEL